MMAAGEGAEIFYTTRGSGPVLLVPSAIGTDFYDRTLPAALSARLTLALVDLRGGGRSTGDPATLTFDRAAGDFDAVRRALGQERVAVMGHSILGALAIEYGRRRPEAVSHVITVGTPPWGGMARLQAEAASFFERDASPERKERLRANRAALPADPTPGQAVLAQAPLRYFDPAYDSSPLFAAAVLRPALMQHLLGPLTAGWDVSTDAARPLPPLLLVHGRCDYVVPPTLWDGVVERLPGARFTLMERSSHHPFVDEPERFASTVLRAVLPGRG